MVATKRGPVIHPVTPKQFLDSLVGKRVAVLLKRGAAYCGVLECADGFMNLVLAEAEMDGLALGSVCVRCNNVKTIEEILN